MIHDLDVMITKKPPSRSDPEFQLLSGYRLYPVDCVVQDHRRRVVRAEHHPVAPDGVQQEAQRLLRVRARSLRDLPRYWSSVLRCGATGSITQKKNITGVHIPRCM